MNSLVILIPGLAIFYFGYRFYAQYLKKRLFGLNNKNITPSHSMYDGIDYVPAKKPILFGHHFASIAGLGPILGPAIAVIWGWLPAVLWIVFGSVFLGAVHDFTILVVSERNGGSSIGDLTAKILNPRTRLLFLILIFFLVALAMGVFVFVLSQLFNMYPEAVFPTAFLMLIAVVIGITIYRKKWPLTPITIIGVTLSLIGVYIGASLPVTGISDNGWVITLLLYSFLASVLPVWLLLQPRDYINSFQLFISMILLLFGIFIFHPIVAAPALHTPAGNPPLVIPFLFITIACGALSGFHSIVSSGTTAKQINMETDAVPIGYGAMLTEGLLALIVVIATTAALGSVDKWNSLYADWGKANSMKPQLQAFVSGASNLLQQIGIPAAIGAVFITVVIVSFAMTTLDTATRLLRYNVEELGKSLKIKPLTNRYVAALAAVGAIGFFATVKINGKPAGIILWQLFGTGNQLLASLGLLAVSIYLYKKRKPIIYTIIPFILMLVITFSALIMNLVDLSANLAQSKEVFITGIFILILSLWIVGEALIFFLKKKTPASMKMDLK
jgi:carbon starvation protein